MLHHIDIEDTNTWPDSLLKIMSDRKALFIAFHTEEKRIDKLIKEDLTLRFNRPNNPQKEDYADVLASLENILQGQNIVGYHCTRLVPHEIVNIKANGLKMLTKELVNVRLQDLLKLGYLNEEQYRYICTSELLQDNLNNKCGHRTGYIWFCPNRSTLKDGGAVCRLLKSWGGEAVYNGHEEDKNIGSHLQSIGSPCIIKCSVPMTDINDDLTCLAKRLVSQFIADDISCPDPSADFDMSIERDTSASEVIDVIEFYDPRFLEFTRHQSWNEWERL